MIKKLPNWHYLNITSKSRAVFALLVLLFALFIITAYGCFRFVKNTENDIRITNNLSQQILEMNLGMEKSKNLLNNFFIHYQQMGLEQAHEDYAQPSIYQISKTISLSNEIKKRTFKDLRFSLNVNETDINIFLASAKRFAETSLQAVVLVTRRAAQPNGLLEQLKVHSEQLDTLFSSSPNMRELNAQAHLFYKEYLLTLTRSSMQEVFNRHQAITQQLPNQKNISKDAQLHILELLQKWDALATNLLSVDLDLTSIKKDFQLQEQTVAPISQALITEVHYFTEQAREQIEKAYSIALTITAILAAITLIVMMKLASLLHNTITKRILHLSDVADQFSKGDLFVRARVGDHDELGKLSEIFNTTVFRIQELVKNLENQVILRTQEFQTFKSIFDTANYGSAITDLKGNLLYVNDYYAKIHGYTQEEINNKHLAIFHSEEQLAHFNDITSSFLEDGRFEPSEIWHTHKDGIAFPMLMAGTVVYDQHGAPQSMAVTALDIAEQKQAEIEKSQIEAQYYQAQKMESVGRLAGGVAHDFNNMLSVILGFAEIARASAGTNTSLQNGLTEIINAAHKSADLVRQLLAFSRKQAITPQMVQCNTKLAESRNMLERLIGEDVHLHYDLDDTLGPVLIDPSQFDQVITNLVVNARDAIQGVGTIKISTEHVTFAEDYCHTHTYIAPGKYSMVAVEDSGCGMSQEIMTQIFEPFFTTKEQGKGTGLGLSTVFGIVKQNGGAVNVYSEEGQGTIVKVYFPLHETTKTGLTKDMPTTTTIQGTETILIVEDETSLLRLCSTILESLGYTVVGEQNPQSALDHVKQNPRKFDLLLTDVIMPDMNGNQLREAIEEIQPQIKTLFMSGYTSEIISYQGVVAKSVNFIQKPFSKQSLAEKIRSILDAR